MQWPLLCISNGDQAKCENRHNEVHRYQAKEETGIATRFRNLAKVHSAFSHLLPSNWSCMKSRSRFRELDYYSDIPTFKNSVMFPNSRDSPSQGHAATLAQVTADRRFKVARRSLNPTDEIWSSTMAVKRLVLSSLENRQQLKSKLNFGRGTHF